MGRLAHFAAALSLALCLGRSAAAPAAPLVARERFGVNQDLIWDPPESVRPQIEWMKRVGLAWVRLPLRWLWIEPKPGEYRWAEADAVVAQLNAADLRLLAVLNSVPEWASTRRYRSAPGDGRWLDLVPADFGEFARFARQAAARYRGRIAAYEIFNEPNLAQFWPPRPDADEYVRLLCAGYRAVKAADPEALVVAGGLAGNGVGMGWEAPESRGFLERMYAAGGGECFDAVAIHPYVHPVAEGRPALQRAVEAARGVMRAHGDARPLWITEIGWSTAEAAWSGEPDPEALVGDWVAQVYADLTGVDRIFWYNFKDVRAASPLAEHHFGLLHYDLTPKPGYEALRAVISHR